MSSTSNEHAGIQVSVTPSQSAFFAGESFSVSITFTNTRQATPAKTQPRSASFTPVHRRGVQSVSSAPLARPPTSPRSPSTAHAFSTAFPLAEEATQRKRKGLLGQDSLPDPRLSAVAAADRGTLQKSRLSTKSLSVSITPSELVERLSGKSLSNPASPNPSSESLGQNNVVPSSIAPGMLPPSRHPALPVHPSHPHARKNSVQDYQVQELATPFSLSLDPISENSVTVPTTPYLPSPSPASSAAFNVNGRRATDGPAARPARGSPARHAHGRKASLANAAADLGIGKPPSSSGAAVRQPRSAFSSTFSPPGTEILLWAYAQLSGTIEMDDSVVPYTVSDDLRDRLRRSGAVGRGSMDIGGSASSSPGFFSAFLPQRSPRSPMQRHQRASPSFLPGLGSFSLSSLLGSTSLSPFSAAGVGGLDEGALPTLDLQPSVIAVDLALQPGESRTYLYTLMLPSVLPPTFRGKAIRFSYDLVVGTSHAPSSTQTFPPSTPAPERQRKRVMKIPIRVYNAVSVHSPPTGYDLLWPVQSSKGPKQGKTEELARLSNRRTNKSPIATGPSAASYARHILQAAYHSSLGASSRPRRSSDEDAEDVWTCREAVEILTRNSRKASYDIARSGDKVAVLTLVKSSYRLGETIIGVVELNDPAGRAQVLKFSAFLEAHEHLPSWLASNKARDLRRVHAEYHSSITPNATRVPFSLEVPSDGSPAFEFTAQEVGEGHGGLEWRLRLCFLVAVSNLPTKHLVQDGPAAEEWGSAWKAAATLAPLTIRAPPSPSSIPSTPVPGAWSEMFSTLGEGASKEHDGQEWIEVKAETVECEIPLQVWPGNTAFRPVETIFGA